MGNPRFPIATRSNCGKLSLSLHHHFRKPTVFRTFPSRGLIEKSIEGPRVMTGSNGNSMKNRDNPQPRVSLHEIKVQRLDGRGFGDSMFSNNFLL
jgi:hypothetical protein